MNETAKIEYSQLDRALNAAYSKALQRADSTRLRKLREAQRAWLKFRDAEAALCADLERGGSAAAVEEWQTKLELTRLRITQLEKYQ